MSGRVIDYGLGRLDSASVKELATVDPRLCAVVLVALARFHQRNPGLRVRVTDGHRSADEQEKLIAEGKSQTRNSAHLDGRAVDLAILKPSWGQGKKWEAVWDFGQYKMLDEIFIQPASLDLGFEPGDILWGGHWTTLRDGVHWQLMLPAL